MVWETIKNSTPTFGTQLNLMNYKDTYSTFHWDEIISELEGGDGIDVEVIDLRTLHPLDDETYLDSIANTHRAMIVDEGWRSGSISAEISARIMEKAFYELDLPVERICSVEVPIPYAKHMEAVALPSTTAIVETVRRIVK